MKFHAYTHMQQRTSLLIVLGIIAVLAVLVLAVQTSERTAAPVSDRDSADAEESPADAGVFSASAKGVIQLGTPPRGTVLSSPLQVTGFVYGNTGTLRIELKQKGSGVVVASKSAPIRGAADRIDFAESLLFALPAMPQPGILTVSYTDASGKGLDDAVSIEVAFPSDLGSGR
ncbi:MAG: hypothetical protein G01um1014106_46 [Parcubacteria group bacterium Gr01-1014_106]|nr:MAG: hypothetical protein G01um1014106_46 [Parcubacteria group bacterium Gr01-1014_106]